MSLAMVEETKESFDKLGVSVSGILVEITEPLSEVPSSNSLGLVGGVSAIPVRASPSNPLTSTGEIVGPLADRGSLVFVHLGGPGVRERDGTADTEFLVA
jgi:hypothetical protein